eukprot:349438_1
MQLRSWNYLFVPQLFQSRVMDFCLEIFFNCMAHADKPELSEKYFNLMTEKYKLIPDVVKFTTLIKGCRKQGLWELASKYLEIMQNRYKLEPTKRTYTEIISVYGNAQKHALAKTLFAEYLDKIEKKQMPVNQPTFNAYLNVFSRIGDMKEAENVLQIMDKYGIQLNIVSVTDIMRGYL